MLSSPTSIPCTLLAEQFRDVAQSANTRKVEGRVADLKIWRQVLAQFIPVVLRECRNFADAGKYECQISLSKLLRASQHSAAFPETKVKCWQCQGGEQRTTSSVLRGCFFSTQAESMLDPPAKFDFDVTDFISALSPVVVSEVEMHGFVVKTSSHGFNMGCPHLRLFTPVKEAPDILLISWRGGKDSNGTSTPQRPSTQPDLSKGNLMMICGVCQEEQPMQAIVPCGHLICGSCWDTAGCIGQCPFCRGHAFSLNPLFVP